MKRANINLESFMELVEKGHVKVGRYEYTRSVDENGDTHFRRYYRKGDEIIAEEVIPYQ
jgi:hypothetical protein